MLTALWTAVMYIWHHPVVLMVLGLAIVVLMIFIDANEKTSRRTHRWVYSPVAIMGATLTIIGCLRFKS